MFILFKIIVGFILTYLAIFGITIVVTKVVDLQRIKNEKVYYISKAKSDIADKEPILPPNKSNNRKWNSLLGVWEEL